MGLERLLTLGYHHLLKPVPFDQELLVAFLASGVILVFDVDDRTADRGHTLQEYL